ncbi:LysR family transcriptional regulator [Streptacidiphilus jiangxiensis]|uniref:DNA-binding transcriptional regulator, LysR family n=1 Tax=Streptacidiphilus jiangxiensis TaxID=235985 RepID=A0A1H7R1X5_STRJI|nr:LysR family transcriptional regulator [Streptacidiphilus jiangxiensis]SEL53988.1 DNA-binding transcriptional regulator, LysR family [Streptacidiphilus jiangxiensis]
MNLELHHLRTLRAIAEAGSVSRAAVVLGYSQPAISRQLRRIEEYFGETLFQRGPSGVEPTAYGAELLAEAGEVLAHADALARRAASRHRGTRPGLRLAATNTPILPGMVSRVHSRLPDLGLQLNSAYGSPAMVALLEQGRLDAAIAADYPGQELCLPESVTGRGIVTEPSFVALPSGHRLRQRPEVALGELAEDAWFLTPDDGAGWHEVFYGACQDAGFRPAPVHEFLGDTLQLQDMVAQGLGVAAVQATRVPVPGVVIKPLTGRPLRCRYVLLWHRDRVDEELAETLLGAATAAYRDLITQASHLQACASWL